MEKLVNMFWSYCGHYPTCAQISANTDSPGTTPPPYTNSFQANTIQILHLCYMNDVEYPNRLL